MRFLHRVALAAVVTLPFATAEAKAQDAMRAPWSGPYVGLAIGPHNVQNTWSTTSLGPNNVFGVDPSTGDFDFSQTTFRFAGYAGYDYPVSSSAIIGVEADIGADPNTDKIANGIPGVVYPVSRSVDSVTSARDFDASLRGRLGVLPDDATLLYLTGGVAFQQISYAINCPASDPAASWCAVPESGKNSKVEVGFTFGGGVEAKAWDRFRLRAEYRYSAFGNTTQNFFGGSNLGIDSVSARTGLSAHTISLGIAYAFGD